MHLIMNIDRTQLIVNKIWLSAFYEIFKGAFHLWYGILSNIKNTQNRWLSLFYSIIRSTNSLSKDKTGMRLLCSVFLAAANRFNFGCRSLYCAIYFGSVLNTGFDKFKPVLPLIGKLRLFACPSVPRRLIAARPPFAFPLVIVPWGISQPKTPSPHATYSVINTA